MLSVEASGRQSIESLEEIRDLTDFQKPPTSASMLHIEVKAIETSLQTYLWLEDHLLR